MDADHTYCKIHSQNPETIITPSAYKDHNYQISASRIKYSHDQQYADDTSWISESKEFLNKILKTIPHKLKQRNLFVNKSKTEQYSIRKNGSTEWKKCKYLGSMLDTESDIQRRKGLAFNSFNTIRKFLVNKKSTIKNKVRRFDAFVSTIFLYNSELWIMTEKMSNKVDVLQRIFLKNYTKGNKIRQNKK